MILAVHISDAVLRPEWWLAGWVGAGLLAAWGLFRLSPEEMPRLAMVTAIFFVATSVHFPIGAGRVHLLLTAFVGILAGRRSGLVVLCGLLLQNRLIGHGGLLSLGFNTVIMAVPAVIIGALFNWFVRAGSRTPVSIGLLGGAAGFLGVIMAVTLGYGGLHFGSQPEWQSVTWMFLVVHIPVALVEALVTGFLLNYLARSGYSFSNPTGTTSSNGTSH
jgi:cobalt/nickel transport system permease protein